MDAAPNGWFYTTPTSYDPTTLTSSSSTLTAAATGYSTPVFSRETSLSSTPAVNFKETSYKIPYYRLSQDTTGCPKIAAVNHQVVRKLCQNENSSDEVTLILISINEIDSDIFGKGFSTEEEVALYYLQHAGYSLSSINLSCFPAIVHLKKV